MVITRTVFLSLVSFIVISCSGQERAYRSLRAPSFSVDGDKVFLDYCVNRDCDLVMYSVAEGTVTILRPSNDEFMFSHAGFGPQPNQVAAVISARAATEPRESQIVLLDLQENTYRRMTSDEGIKSSPNFSFDGRRLAYAQSHRDRTWFNGDPRATAWDLHTLDVATGGTKRITSYCFWGLGKPFFYPGSDDLVAHAEGPMCNYPTPSSPPEAKGYLKYRERFGENNVVRLGPTRNVLEPWFTNGDHASAPGISRTGDVLFVSRTNGMDGITKGAYNYDLFFRYGDRVRRLTRLGTMISGSALSADGRFVAYLSDIERNHLESLWIYDIERDTHVKSDLRLLGISSKADVPIRTFVEETAKRVDRS